MVPGSNPGGPTNKAPLEAQNSRSQSSWRSQNAGQETEAQDVRGGENGCSLQAESFSQLPFGELAQFLSLLTAANTSQRLGMLTLKELAEIIELFKERLLGQKPSGLAIRWDEQVRDRYIKWMTANRKSKRYLRTCLYYLDKFMCGRELRTPSDVVDMFNECKRGVNNLNKALRTLLNYYLEVERYPEDFIKALKKAIPREVETVELFVPTEEQIIETLRKLKSAPHKYITLYWFVLATGVRKEHAIDILNNFDIKRVVRIY